MGANITKIDFKEKHYMIEVDDIKYEVPQRTPVLEEKIRNHDENIKNMSEYEANYNLLEILFGEENAKQMFPDKETTNLDKLAMVSNAAVEAFMTEYNRIKTDALKNSVEELKPLLSAVDKATKLANKK